MAAAEDGSVVEVVGHRPRTEIGALLGEDGALHGVLTGRDGLLIGPSTETILKAGAQATVLLLGADGGMGAVTADALFEGRTHSQ